MRNASWTVGKGATIGASAVILPNVSIGPYAFVAAGAVVTKSIPAHVLVAGNPAVPVSSVCNCGRPWKKPLKAMSTKCPSCNKSIDPRYLKGIRKVFDE